MRGGNTKEMVMACAERIRQDPEAVELETTLAVFASYVLSTDIIKQILRWEMTIVTIDHRRPDHSHSGRI
jgi:hypothetical protein